MLFSLFFKNDDLCEEKNDSICKLMRYRYYHCYYIDIYKIEVYNTKLIKLISWKKHSTSQFIYEIKLEMLQNLLRMRDGTIKNTSNRK